MSRSSLMMPSIQLSSSGFSEAGTVVIVSLISPYRADRALARRIAGDIPFLEVFVDTPLGL